MEGRRKGTNTGLEPELKRLPFKTAKRQLIDAFEFAYLHALVRRYGTNITRASRGADLSRRQLRELMRKHGYLPRSVPPEPGGLGPPLALRTGRPSH